MKNLPLKTPSEESAQYYYIIEFIDTVFYTKSDLIFVIYL
jgi:hypothetical protein